MMITYLEAIREGLMEEMEADPRVFLLGEDIGAYGGAFKVTAGLLEKFGESRVIDTPISESAIVGAAIGAALYGMRPVAEMQFIDFIACAFDMITNYAAKAHYCWGAAIPIVIRGPAGGLSHAGPFHSQNVESYFVHTPGLKAVAPSTPREAKGLIKAAIRDPNPVLYFEHKYLYRRIKEDVPRDDWVIPLGKAVVKREGRHLSIITYGAMVHVALEAATALARVGIEAEFLIFVRSGRWMKRPCWPQFERRTRFCCCTKRPASAALAGSWRPSSPKRRLSTWMGRLCASRGSTRPCRLLRRWRRRSLPMRRVCLKQPGN